MNFKCLLLFVLSLFILTCGPTMDETLRKLGREFYHKNLYYNYQDTILVTGPSMTYTFKIPRGASMSKLGNAAYRDLLPYRKYGLYGVKLLYELSGDMSGYTNANKINAGDEITFYSVRALGLEAVNIEDETLPGAMIRGDITFLDGIVE